MLLNSDLYINTCFIYPKL